MARSIEITPLIGTRLRPVYVAGSTAFLRAARLVRSAGIRCAWPDGFSTSGSVGPFRLRAVAYKRRIHIDLGSIVFEPTGSLARYDHYASASSLTATHSHCILRASLVM